MQDLTLAIKEERVATVAAFFRNAGYPNNLGSHLGYVSLTPLKIKTSGF